MVSSGSRRASWPDDAPVPLAGCPAATVTLQWGDASTDVFGVPVDGLRREPPLRVAGEWRVALAADDTPWGPYECTLIVDGIGRIGRVGGIDQGSAGACDVTVAAPYAELVSWLHDGWVLGELLRRGRRVTGDLFAWSATSGVISAPTCDTADVWAVTGRLVRYARAQLDRGRTPLTNRDGGG